MYASGRWVRRDDIRVYAAALLVAGGALVGASCVTLGHSLRSYERDRAQRFDRLVRPRSGRDFPGRPDRPFLLAPALGGREGGLLRQAERDARQAQQDRLIRLLGLALAALLTGSVAGGWLLAGRALRPVAQIAASSRRVAAGRLDERIDLRGPRDELKELADSFDAMLDRLEHAVEQQRRFADNASHELRTPLATIRGAVTAALDDPGASASDLRAMAAVVARATDRSERLIDGLLTLARTGQRLRVVGPIDLAELTEASVEEIAPAAREAGIELRWLGAAAEVTGDPVLLERAIANLLENAVTYNHGGGEVTVSTGAVGGHAYVEVGNTVPAVPAALADQLFTPFFRAEESRSREAGGAGLGLAIVRRVAEAHGGRVTAAPRPSGGLTLVLQSAA